MSQTQQRLGQYIPLTPQAAIADAVAVYKAGARIVHVHARNPRTGEQWSSPAWYCAFAESFRQQCPEAMLGFPTSRKGEVAKQIEEAIQNVMDLGAVDAKAFVNAEMIRASGLEALPDTITTFTASEVPIAKRPRGVKSDENGANIEILAEYYKTLVKRAYGLGVGQEVEITSNVCLDALNYIAASSELGIGRAVHFVVLLGFSSSLPVEREACERAVQGIIELCRTYDVKPLISVGAVIRPWEAALECDKLRSEATLPSCRHDYREVLEWVFQFEAVDVIRVGLEDTPFLYGRQQTNAALVEEVVALCAAHDVAISTDIRAIRALMRPSAAK